MDENTEKDDEYSDDDNLSTDNQDKFEQVVIS